MALKATLVRQAVSKESLFSVLADWCKEGAGKRNWCLRILSAFVSGKGILAISPLLDVFLSDGNSLEIIFGVDRGGTDRDAIRRLYALRRAYPRQASIRLFHAPAKASIFHPKLYLLDTGQDLRLVLGSANLTFPGLATNLESLVLYKGVRRTSGFAKEIITLWETFAKPHQPLRPRFLQTLTERIAERYARTLPRKHIEERDHTKSLKAVWKPLSHVLLPRSSETIGRKPSSPFLTKKGQYLLMDVLKETRSTQMQVPLDVIEKFFGIPRDREDQINLSIWSDQVLTQPIIRRVVKSTGKEQRRLMRRLEMPQIREMKRPLVVLFLSIRGRKRFAFLLMPQATRAWRKADRLLRKHGQQGKKVRRYVIGRRDDTVWKDIQPLLKGEW